MKKLAKVFLIILIGVSMLVGCGESGNTNSGNTNTENNEQTPMSDEEKVSQYLEEFMDSVVLDGMNWLEAKGDATMGYYFNESGKYSSSNLIVQTDRYKYYGGIVKVEELFEDAAGEREYFVSGVTRDLNLDKLYVTFKYGLWDYDIVEEKNEKGFGYVYKVDSLERLKTPEYKVDSISAHIDWAYWKDTPEHTQVAPEQAKWLEGAMPYLIEHECEGIDDIMRAWELDVLQQKAYNTYSASEASVKEFTYDTKYGNVRFIVDNQTGTSEDYSFICSLYIIFEDAECGYISFTEYTQKNDDGEDVTYLDYTLTREKYVEE